MSNESNLKRLLSTGVVVAIVQAGFVPPASGSDYLYWVDEVTRKIERAPLVPGGIGAVETILSVGFITPKDIALDLEGGFIYWVDCVGNQLARTTFDGSSQPLAPGQVVFPWGLALDFSNNYVYWTESTVFHCMIKRARLDGTLVQTLVADDLNAPKGMAVNSKSGKLYWVESGLMDVIKRANLDGSQIETLVPDSFGLGTPFRIALDTVNGKMYWTDFQNHRIYRANLDGSDIEDVVTGLSIPQGIALDVARGHVYWSDQGTRKIQRANFDGTHIVDIVTEGIDIVRAIALDLRGGDGDADGDGDVDLLDFGWFSLCYTGPGAAGVEPVDQTCSFADFDCDHDVDLVDFGSFSLAFTGPL